MKKIGEIVVLSMCFTFPNCDWSKCCENGQSLVDEILTMTNQHKEQSG